jgi:hypothetical protein
MRLLVILPLVVLPMAVGAQEKVPYRNVDLSGRDTDAVGIEFTLHLPDSLAAVRVRTAGERRKLDFGRSEPGSMHFGKTAPGVCEGSKGMFVEPGQRPPTGPCHITYRVTWRPDRSGGTTFVVSAAGFMPVPGTDVVTGGAFTPRSSNWKLVRQLAREIAEARE